MDVIKHICEYPVFPVDKQFKFVNLFEQDAGYPESYFYVYAESEEEAQTVFNMFVEKIMDIEDKYGIVIPDDIYFEPVGCDGGETVVCIKGWTRCVCGEEYLLPCFYCHDINDGHEECWNCPLESSEEFNRKKYDFTKEEIELLYKFV